GDAIAEAAHLRREVEPSLHAIARRAADDIGPNDACRAGAAEELPVEAREKPPPDGLEGDAALGVPGERRPGVGRLIDVDDGAAFPLEHEDLGEALHHAQHRRPRLRVIADEEKLTLYFAAEVGARRGLNEQAERAVVLLAAWHWHEPCRGRQVP